MPVLKLADCELFYRVDDFTDPWTTPETVLMLHGNAESSLSWYAWVPVLARHCRVVRPDMRGYGQSTPMPRDYEWTFDQLIDDYCRLLDQLGIERFHLVAAKIGGTVARVFAARRPDRLLSLTVVGTPQAKRPGAEQIPALIEEYETKGAEHWARRTMDGRLGEHFPAEGVEWWTRFMGRAPVSSLIGFNRSINYADISAELPRIKCPTLVVTTEESGLGTVERTREWQQQIPDSRLLVLPGKSYHVAASDAEDCARETLAFIRESSKRNQR
ncbi:MAG: alpha/beta hydrolase [Burkholderiales bacterium]|nr:alpha/beta hydrolase [Burkholderiales bacterium]MDP2397306.1 alpha/beta hydrolase [Burkholderiales bacterium]